MRISSICTFLLLALTSSLTGQADFTDVSDNLNLFPKPGAESIAIADFNDDGLEDIYVGYTIGPNELWQNLGNGVFTEIALSAGVAGAGSTRTKAAVWGDFDNDGLPDLYLANKDVGDQYFRNNGDGTFTDQTLSAGFGQVGNPLSVNLADVDQDGFLDIYVTNFLLENIFYRNNGDGTFSDDTQASGLLDRGKSMASLFFDYDRDGDPDLYLVHDGFEPNLLYQNQGDGTFLEVAAAAQANTESFGMGVDIGDFNNDGWPDLYITNLYQNYLLWNDGDGTFTEGSTFALVGDPGMGWGTTTLDINNDGLVDVYAANDYGFSPFTNVLYVNQGDRTFRKLPDASPLHNTYKSYGTATFDYNLDGRPDLAVANRGAEENWQLFRNEATTGNWITLKLLGTESNRQAIGATIRAVDNLGHIHYDEITGGQGWTSQNSSYLHFGLGAAERITEGIIRWPSGREQLLSELAGGQLYTVEEGNAPVAGVQPAGNGTTATTARRASLATVFPSPTNNWLYLEAATNQLLRSITITSLEGQLLYQETLPPGASRHRLQLRQLRHQGILLLNVQTDTESQTIKILVH